MPERYQRWSASFRRHLPDWEYRFWDDQDCLDFVQKSFPQHLPIYHSLENPAAKADLFRYLVLLEYGGLYADIDCECRRPLDFLDAQDEFVVGPELDTTSPRVMQLIRSDRPRVYCQWAFLSAPGHPILHQLVHQISEGIHSRLSPDAMKDILKRTGPHAFTDVIERYVASGAGPVRFVPSSYFGACEGNNVFRFALSYFLPELFRTVYVRHHFEMSWVDAKTRRDMMIRNLFFLKERESQGPG